MHTTIALLLAASVVSLVLVICFSYTQCISNTRVWQAGIEERLVDYFHLKPEIAAQLVEKHYPLMAYAFKEHPHAGLLAADLFWKENDDDQSCLHYSFYNEKGRPSHLFTSSNYGRVSIDA